MADPGSFDDAVSGCDYVMHVASVVSVKIPRARVREEQIDPSIHGVENILSAIEKTSSVKAFILTSSLSAVYGDCWERGPDHTFTEDDWNATATETFFPYALSKTLSERRAWDLYEQIKTNRVAQEESTHEDATPEDENLMKTMPRWRMVAILPAFVVGPPAVPGTSELVEFASKLMAGKIWPFMPNAQFPFVDLEDVAAAHVLAALVPTAEGRVIVSHGSGTMGLLDAVRSLQPRFPDRRFPMWELPKWALWILCKVTGLFPWDLAVSAVGKPVGVDGSKACRVLGLDYHNPLDGLAALLARVAELE